MRIDGRLSRGLLVLALAALSEGACAPHVDRDGDGFLTEEGDCDDRNPAVYPGADEVCEPEGAEPVDNDCDGEVNDWLEGCEPGSPTETPGMTETSMPELTPTPKPATPTPTPYCVGTDMDGDGYCVPEDCDDASKVVHPGAFEMCNGRDNDCDGYLPTCWGAAEWGISTWLRGLFGGQ